MHACSLLLLVACCASFQLDSLRPRLPALRLAMTEPPEKGETNPLLDAMGALSDASWDMFVMPGEAANSMYDRPLEPMESDPSLQPKGQVKGSVAPERTASTFDWSGDGEDEEALRLPKGVKAAERLAGQSSPPLSALWFEIEGRDIAGDTEFLSRMWTVGWAAFVVLAVTVALQTGIFSTRIGAASVDQETYIRERVEVLRKQGLAAEPEGRRPQGTSGGSPSGELRELAAPSAVR